MNNKIETGAAAVGKYRRGRYGLLPRVIKLPDKRKDSALKNRSSGSDQLIRSVKFAKVKRRNYLLISGSQVRALVRPPLNQSIRSADVVLANLVSALCPH